MKREKEPILSGRTPALAQPAPCSPIARDSGALAAAASARLGARLVAGRAMGVLHLHDVDRHVFLGAHRLGPETHPALAGSLADRQPIRTHPPSHPQVRALYGIFYFLPVALSRRAWRPQRVALDVGPRGTLLCRWILGPG